LSKLIKKNDVFFVAGHNGMVGQSIVRSLLNKGYCDPKNEGKLITQGRSDLNLLNFEDVNKWFKVNNPNVVIIAAAKVGGIKANSDYPFDFIFENLKIQQNIIENSWKHGVRRLLFLGSSCIYPKFAKQPIKEDELLTGSLEATNQWYAVAKIAGIKLCEALRIQHDFDAISLMPTNLYGPGDNYEPSTSHVFAALIRKFILAKEFDKRKVICWGDGSPLREFLHVDDLGDACIHALENWDPNRYDAPTDKFGNYLSYLNVGTGIDVTIKDLANMIAKIVDYDGEIEWDESKPNGTPKKQLDISKIKSLGWQPNIKLEEGIRMTIEDIKRNCNFSEKTSKSIKNFFK